MNLTFTHSAMPVPASSLPAVPLGWNAMPSFGQGYAQWAGATVDWSAATATEVFTTRPMGQTLLDEAVHSSELDSFWNSVSMALRPENARTLAA